MGRIITVNWVWFLVQWTPVVALTAPSSSSSSSPTIRQIPWLIVGGGIHGVHIATRLLGEGVTDNLCIVDDGRSLLHKWKTRTEATGMEYLRSSAGYHLDLTQDSLRKFGKHNNNNDDKSNKHLFTKDYERPQLEFFNQHCDAIIQEHELDKKHIKGKVTGVNPQKDHVRVVVSRSTADVDEECEYMAENVVLALGNDDPFYPDWVTPDLIDSGIVKHVFDANTKDPPLCSDVAIIGGGITAAHKAIQLAQQKEKDNTVHLISRHPLMEQQFDTHQDWMMDQAAVERSQEGGGSGQPKRQRQFQETTSLQQRRHIIAQERVPGTVTAAVNRGHHGLQYLIRENQVQWHEAAVSSVSKLGHNRCQLQLSSGTTMDVDLILLATGFGKCLPALLKQVSLDQHQPLPTSDFCGYPIVDASLRWGHPRLYVTGALAELELGPSARNIAGARLAAERIVQAARSSSGRLSAI